jgi:dTDP-4-dehydrorhamnose reductase
MKIAVIGTTTPAGFAILESLNAEESVERVFSLNLPDFNPADAANVRQVFETLQPDLIVNAFLFPDPDRADQHPNTLRTVHVRAAEALCAAAQAIDARVALISSARVFSGNQEHHESGFTEQDEPIPDGMFAVSLRDAEMIVAASSGGLVIRMGELFGPLPQGGSPSFVDRIARAARRTYRVLVVDGDRHSPIYSRDLAAALTPLLLEPDLIPATKTGRYLHIANRGPASRLELAEATLCLLDSKSEAVSISAEEYGADAPRSDDTALDLSLLESLTSVSAIRSWRDALKVHIDTV